MQKNDVPMLGPRYWATLFLECIFGANTGDLVADSIGAFIRPFMGLPLSS